MGRLSNVDISALRAVALSALGGAQDGLARGTLGLLGRLAESGASTQADLTALRSVIAGRWCVVPAEEAKDASALHARLTHGTAPLAVRLDADEIVATLHSTAGAKPWFAQALAAACAIQVDVPGRAPAFGSGVLVRENPPVVMTNRHVVEHALSAGGNGPALKPGAAVAALFGDSLATARRIEAPDVWIAPDCDMALAWLDDPGDLPAAAVPVSASTPFASAPRGMLIGFPGKPSGADERRAFNNHLGTKVVCFGSAGMSAGQQTFAGIEPWIVFHDMASCEGMSGSPLFPLGGMRPAGLHFYGASMFALGRYGNKAIDLGQQRAFAAHLSPASSPAPPAPGPQNGDADITPVAEALAPAAAPLVQITVGAVPRALSAQRDFPDPRDLPYVATLTDLPARIYPTLRLPVTDQGAAPTCVGHALATAINILILRRLGQPPEGKRWRASARMLDTCAHAHDDLPAELRPGSTLRGAIKGFFHNGVAIEDDISETDAAWTLTRERARAARAIRLSGYQRIGRDPDALHAAIRDTGAVLASARIHQGWVAPHRGQIGRRGADLGGHAFVLVGYDRTGFLVLNSWGADWGGWRGRGGVARWRYDDAMDSLLDAWALQLAVPAPTLARVVQKLRAAAPAGALRRSDVIGHVLPLSAGDLHRTGKFGFGPEVHAETAHYLGSVAQAKRPRYRDVVLLCHDLLRDRAEVAARTAAVRSRLKASSVWPLSVTLDTALGRTLDSLLARETIAIGPGTPPGLLRLRLAQEARPAVQALWERLGSEIPQALGRGRPGGSALRAICDAATPLRLHVIGQGLGALVAGWLLRNTLAGVRVHSLALIDPVLPLADVTSLIAPSVESRAPALRFTVLAAGSRPFADTGVALEDLLESLLGRPIHRPAAASRPQIDARRALDDPDALVRLVRWLGRR